MFSRGERYCAVVAVLLLMPVSSEASANRCPPTPQDEIGPYYHPNAPQRTRIGSGYLLTGVVRDAADCRPIPGARIEVWQAGPDGDYGDAWRATLYADDRGRYRLETNFPPPYARRPPHIHILVDMKGYAGLITQHYPKAGRTSAHFDLVMKRE
jgi:protocatechuate 3,4-dioxygenase beta subunit